MAKGPIITLGSVLQAKADRMILALRTNLENDDSIASRKLIQSIRTQVSVFGETFSMDLYMEDYWKYVEKGRGSGKMPPIDNIIKWTSQKGLPIGDISKRRRGLIKSLKNRVVKKGLKQRSKDAIRRSVAYLIARKIAKKGTKGTDFYSKVVNPSWVQNLQGDIAKALKKDYTIQILNSAE